MGILNDYSIEKINAIVDENYFLENNWKQHIIRDAIFIKEESEHVITTKYWVKKFKPFNTNDPDWLTEDIYIMYNLASDILKNSLTGEQIQTVNVLMIEDCINIWRENKKIW